MNSIRTIYVTIEYSNIEFVVQPDCRKGLLSIKTMIPSHHGLSAASALVKMVWHDH